MTAAALHGGGAIDTDRDERHLPSHGMRLLHIVGKVTDEVFSFLGPATQALSNNGHAQHIVAIDSSAHRHNVRQFDEYATVTRIAKASNPIVEWNGVRQACKSELAKGDISALHVHGLVPFLVSSTASISVPVRPPVVYSPHGSRSLGNLRFVGRLAMLAARSATRHGRPSAIVTLPHEAGAFKRWEVADVIENPVADVFFSAVRHESEKPLIVTGGRETSIRSVEIFSQLAVLLSGEELGLNFNWLGSAPVAAQQQLKAASVAILPVLHDDEFASAVRKGWMYVAPWSTHGFPLFLVQAMAAGLPCVALDCDQHREVIEDGKNGFLCASEQEMVSVIAALVDDAELRRKMGAVARATAEARFKMSKFEGKLMTAYSTRW